MKRLFLVVLFCGASLNASSNVSQKSPRKKISVFEHVVRDESPANLLLFWALGLNGEKYDQSRHILEHVYDNKNYAGSNFESRQQAVVLCQSGACGKAIDPKFKSRVHHFARKGLDAAIIKSNQALSIIEPVMHYAGDDDLIWSAMCPPCDDKDDN